MRTLTNMPVSVHRAESEQPPPGLIVTDDRVDVRRAEALAGRDGPRRPLTHVVVDGAQPAYWRTTQKFVGDRTGSDPTRRRREAIEPIPDVGSVSGGTGGAMGLGVSAA